MLAIKPQEFPAAGRSLNSTLNGKQTVMSIMAGVTIETIRSARKHDAIVRAIPNTPAQIGEGMTVWTGTEAVRDWTREAVRRSLSVLGRVLYVTGEQYSDIAHGAR